MNRNKACQQRSPRNLIIIWNLFYHLLKFSNIISVQMIRI